MRLTASHLFRFGLLSAHSCVLSKIAKSIACLFILFSSELILILYGLIKVTRNQLIIVAGKLLSTEFFFKLQKSTSKKKVKSKFKSQIKIHRRGQQQSITVTATPSQAQRHRSKAFHFSVHKGTTQHYGDQSSYNYQSIVPNTQNVARRLH